MNFRELQLEMESTGTQARPRLHERETRRGRWDEGVKCLWKLANADASVQARAPAFPAAPSVALNLCDFRVGARAPFRFFRVRQARLPLLSHRRIVVRSMRLFNAGIARVIVVGLPLRPRLGAGVIIAEFDPFQFYLVIVNPCFLALD